MADNQGSARSDPEMLAGGTPALDAIRKIAEALQDHIELPKEDDSAPDSLDESFALQLERERAEADRIKAETGYLRQTQELREKYAGRVYRIVKWWVRAAIALLVLDAVDPPQVLNDTAWIAWLPAFDIEKQVMIAFLGGTTVAIVGLVLAVVKGLFPGSPKN